MTTDKQHLQHALNNQMNARFSSVYRGSECMASDRLDEMNARPLARL